MSGTIEIGNFRFDPVTGRLEGPAGRGRLTPKPAAVLAALAACGDRVATRVELVAAVWGDSPPKHDVLSQAIKEIRAALADPSLPGSDPVVTVPKVGYRLAWPVVAPSTAVAAPATRRRSTFVALAVGAAVVVVIALVVGSMADATRTTPPPSPHVAGRLQYLTSDPERERDPALSPDGSRVAYAVALRAGGPTRIVVQSSSGSKVVPITPAAGEHEELAPVWFPDGRRIAFLRRVPEQSCTVITASATGGDERRIEPCGIRHNDYFDLSPDSRQLLVARFDRRRADGDGGEQRTRIVEVDLESFVRRPLPYATEPHLHDWGPRYSPDGRWIALRRGNATPALVVVPRAGGSARVLVPAMSRGQAVAWTADSRGLVYSLDDGLGSMLHFVPLAGGAPVSLGLHGHSPTLAGDQLVFIEEDVRRSLVLYDEDGTPLDWLQPSGRNDAWPAIAPDGSALALISSRTGRDQVYLLREPRGTPVPLTDLEADELVWAGFSADGRAVEFTLRNGSDFSLWRVELSGAQPRRVSPAGVSIAAAAPSPDGHWLYGNVRHEGRWRFARVATADGRVELLGELAITRAPQWRNGNALFTTWVGTGIKEWDGDARDAFPEPVPAMERRSTWTWRDGDLAWVGSANGEFGLYRARAGEPPRRVATVPAPALALETGVLFGRYVAAVGCIERGQVDVAMTRLR